jgi:hypothetical protein
VEKTAFNDRLVLHSSDLSNNLGLVLLLSNRRSSIVRIFSTRFECRFLPGSDFLQFLDFIKLSGGLVEQVRLLFNVPLNKAHLNLTLDGNADVKNTLETSGEDVKNTLETSGEDLKNIPLFVKSLLPSFPNFADFLHSLYGLDPQVPVVLDRHVAPLLKIKGRVRSHLLTLPSGKNK